MSLVRQVRWWGQMGGATVVRLVDDGEEWRDVQDSHQHQGRMPAAEAAAVAREAAVARANAGAESPAVGGCSSRRAGPGGQG